VPTSPGDAGVGAAFSHGDWPVAVPGMTWPSPAAIGWTSGRLEVGVGRPVVVGAEAPDLAPELEQPAATSANTKTPPTTAWTVPRLPMASLLRSRGAEPTGGPDGRAAGVVGTLPAVRLSRGIVVTVVVGALVLAACGSKSTPDAKIVGLSYLVYHHNGAPPGFAGPNDHWHQHNANGGLCLKGGEVVGGEEISRADCAARGGHKTLLIDIWMLHAWVVPGFECTWGVFSGECPELGGRIGGTAYDPPAPN